MKLTSATLVTLVSVLGSLAEALQGSPNPNLLIAGLVLSAIYTMCHSIVAVKTAQSAAQAVPSLQTVVSANPAPELKQEAK